MRMRALALLTTLVCCSPSAALAGPARSAQATYNAAQNAFDKEDWTAAATGFGSLLPSSPDARLGHSQAVIASRLTTALMKLGRFDEARVMGQRAIASLPPDDLELPEVLLATATAAERGYDFQTAAQLYQRAIQGGEKLGALQLSTSARAAFAASQVTVDPTTAVGVLDKMLADQALTAHIDKPNLAALEDLRARAAMNAGDLTAAAKWIGRSIDHGGGLTITVNLSQIASRNDAAIIASLRKDDDATRKYLAYTGAGHLKDVEWISQFDGDLPVCGPGSELRPEDSVIVQFSIEKDGHVTGATPIYASRPGQVGVSFAQAVSQWHWDPAALVAVDAFWLNSLVLQLRCQTRPSPISFAKPVQKELSDWLASKGVDTSDHPDSFVSPNDPRLLLNGPAAIPALFGRLGMQDEGRDKTAVRLREILDANAAPPAAYALLIMAQRRQGSAIGSIKSVERAHADYDETVVPGFRDRYPSGAATALLLLDWSLSLEQAGDFEKAFPLLQAVTAMPTSALPQVSPIRQVALLHAALVGQRIGDTGASQALASSGISADQCSLFDTHPIATSASIGSSKFPEEALRWHFEGYVKESYDIGDDGRVADVRTVIAYPPFIFAKSTEAAVQSFRYLPPKIGDRAVGCSGATQAVNYRIPS